MRRLRRAGIAAAALGSLIATYWAGFRAGQSAQGPDYRWLMVVRKPEGNSTSTSTSTRGTVFDISKPQEALRFRQEEERLKAAGAEYYVARGFAETTVGPGPRPPRTNSRR